MPFVSEKQRRYLYANKPEVAKKFAKHGERSSLKALKKHGKRKKSR